jgi:hypothetical protein
MCPVTAAASARFSATPGGRGPARGLILREVSLAAEFVDKTLQARRNATARARCERPQKGELFVFQRMVPSHEMRNQHLGALRRESHSHGVSRYCRYR